MTSAPTTNPAPATTTAPTTPGHPSARDRVVTGLTPTGPLHLGNYLGAVCPLLHLLARPGSESLVFVADLHAMTSEHDPALLRRRSRELAATLVACGVDERATLFVQSAVPAHTELAYLLECTAAYGEMTRMIQFREKSAGGAVRLSLLTYPALMAADVLLYRASAVPVGDDQRQHLELTRTLAQRFNARYGEVFRVPAGVVPPTAARVRDLRDPRAKMGKSSADSPGVVLLLDEPVRVAAAVRRAVTDLDPVLTYDPDLRPGVANLAELLAALTGGTPSGVLAGLHGAGALKAAVSEAVVETLRPVRERYRAVAADPAELDRRLDEGAREAAARAEPTLAAAREAIGLPPVPPRAPVPLRSPS